MPKNQGYGIFRFVNENGKEQFCKPNPRQRKRILIYYIRRRSGRIMKVQDIAKAFNVSDRTIQKLPIIDKIYDKDNPMKLRDFEWTDFWEYKDDHYGFFVEIGKDFDEDTLRDLREKSSPNAKSGLKSRGKKYFL